MNWSGANYWAARLVFERSLGAIYLIAFLCAANQFLPLLGEHGLLPVPAWVRTTPFRESPSLFYLAPRDWAFAAAAWLGIALSALIVAGVADRYSSWLHGLIWLLVWALYLSFVNVGQVFYSFGWEILLLEAGFLTVFFGSRTVQPPLIVDYLVRWLAFRVMFGAGLIKIRGDECWRDYTCLDYHYQTQPIPNPLSWYFHFGPQWTHPAGVAFNHFAELVAPFGLFLPQPVATIAALIIIVFQFTIFLSGNLSWLNVLTMVLAVPAIDSRYLPFSATLSIPAPGDFFRAVTVALGVLVALLSVNPVRNMLSSRQVMNTSYDALHLVGTYGAFGSITRRRFEIVVEGSDDPSTGQWKEYEFRGKPNDPMRMPQQIAPYHLRLDWLMWFAAMSRYYQHPWFIHFLAKLLEGDQPVLGLLKSNPFPKHPPAAVRAQLYEYRFATPEVHRQTKQWWTRQLVGSYFPPVTLQNPDFQQLLESQGWR
jgi:hypothetical protein